MVYLAPLKSTVIEAQRRRATTEASGRARRDEPESPYMQTVKTVLGHYARLARGELDDDDSIPCTPTLLRPKSSSSRGPLMQPSAGNHIIEYDADARSKYSPLPPNRAPKADATPSAHPRHGSISSAQLKQSPRKTSPLSAGKPSILEMIRQQVEAEGATTLELLQATMKEQSAQGNDPGDNPMVGCCVENTVNESMRSIAEQCKTAHMGVSSAAIADHFTTFASSNALIDTLLREKQGRPKDEVGELPTIEDPTQPSADVWRTQLNKGFTCKGFDVASNHSAAIIFPALEREPGLANSPATVPRSRIDVHVRCMLVGTLLTDATRPKGRAAPTPALTTISTVTPETEYKQQRRRIIREQLQRDIDAHLAASVLGHVAAEETSGEVDVNEAPLPTRTLAPLARRSDEDLLQEVILQARRSSPLSDACIDVIRRQMEAQAAPLRAMREVRRLQLPNFISYSDCSFVPRLLVVYEVPLTDPNQPIRSTLDPTNLYTSRNSFFDDRFDFSMLEYTTRWCVPIAAIKQQLTRDCWVRKQFAFPQTHSHGVPLGTLLQRCGRGCVSIDVAEYQDATSRRPPSSSGRSFGAGTSAQSSEERASVVYRHSFMFADRITAALMKDRRYGRARGKRQSSKPS